MERYEYDKAVAAFREVHTRAPRWTAGTINLAIALLNQTGSDTQAQPASPMGSHYEQALVLLDQVLAREPENLHAHYCRGTILEELGRLGEAHREFAIVVERDPNDAHSWYKLASTLTDPVEQDRPAGPTRAGELIPLYRKALELNPYLVGALYKLQLAYAWSGQAEQQADVNVLWKRLNPRNNVAGPGETTESFYGEMGRYANIIDLKPRMSAVSSQVRSPRFAASQAIDVTLRPGDRWVSRSDYQGSSAILGRARDRFGASVATFDVDGDGRLDLYLPASIVGPKGLRDTLLRNRGEGRFEDATLTYGLPEDRASLAVAAGDFDADGRIDLVTTGVGVIRLYGNRGSQLVDVTGVAGLEQIPAISLAARWLDLDQDGDLDLYVINYAHVDDVQVALTDKATGGATNLVLRNDGMAAPVVGRPRDNWAPPAVATADLPATVGLSIAFSRWPDSGPLLGGIARHTALASLDIDDDRDLDLVLSAEGTPPVALLNDRLGRFHATALEAPVHPGPIDGWLVTDVDQDGRADLAVLSGSRHARVWRNSTPREGAGGRLTWEPWPIDAVAWRSVTSTDLDLDGRPDLIGLDPRSHSTGPAWARNEGHRLSSSPLALAPGAHAGRRLSGLALANFVGDPLPDLVLLRDGTAPEVARNLGNGQHWLELDLAGRWKVHPAQMRTNPAGLGTRLALQGQGLRVFHDQVMREAGLCQSVGPVVLGMGSVPSAELLRLRWPDGTMQSELNVAGDRSLKVVEHNRKTGSCPVLFTWNGDRFVCQGDFLGGGGLGYLVAPGVYGGPDRDESLAVEPAGLRPEQGAYRLTISEPMDECSYLDMIELKIVDRPSGIRVAVDERFAPEGLRPTGEVLAWKTAIEPIRATDLAGRDVTERLRHWDRRTVDDFARRDGWVGYAETHGIVLELGDRLAGLGPQDSLVLCLAGWVEYPYSQTNYAAATAGIALNPPVVERLQQDGSWATIEPNAGYPAGLPRLTTLDLTGKLTGPSCTIRITTNMECYWDQAYFARTERNLPVRVRTLPLARARLEERGALREVSPDGRSPLLYDYDRVDPIPLVRMKGRLTRLGDVATLLRSDDDHLCVIGPGDEVKLEFDANLAPELPEGWTRSFVVHAVGYCKDADPFTRSGDTVGPLPWRGMADYPDSADKGRPDDDGYRTYLREYQTRPSNP